MYISIEELAEKLSVSVSSIRSWLKAGYFSNAAYFNVNTVYRFNFDRVIEELHSGDFGDTCVPISNPELTLKSSDIPEVNRVLLNEYKYLVKGLLGLISRYVMLPEGTNEKLRNFQEEFLGEYNFEYGTSVLLDAVSLLKRYNLGEVVPAINEFIKSNYTDDDDRSALLDTIGIFNDLAKIQNGMLEKLEGYLQYENSTREKLLVHIGADYEALEDIAWSEDALLEELEEMLTSYEDAISQSDEKSKMIMEMRQSLFSDIYDFNNKSFVTRETP